MGGWNREVPLYMAVSSFEGVGIERFHCIDVSDFVQGTHLVTCSGNGKRLHIYDLKNEHQYRYVNTTTLS